MDLSNRSRNTHSIGLTRDHEGIEGRTLFVLRKGRLAGLPETLRDEPEIASLVKKGLFVLSESKAATKAESKGEEKPRKRRNIFPGEGE